MFASSRSLHLFQLRQRHGSQARHCTRHVASEKRCHILLTYRSFPVIWVLPFRSIHLNPQYVWFAYDSDVPFSFPFHAFVHPVMVKVTTTQWNSNVTVTVRFDSVLSCRPMGSFKLTSGQGKNLNFWGSKTYLSWTHPEVPVHELKQAENEVAAKRKEPPSHQRGSQECILWKTSPLHFKRKDSNRYASTNQDHVKWWYPAIYLCLMILLKRSLLRALGSGMCSFCGEQNKPNQTKPSQTKPNKQTNPTNNQTHNQTKQNKTSKQTN